MSDKALIPSTPLVPQNLADLMGLAQFIVNSELCPKGLKAPKDVALVILAGNELGIGVMQSLQELYPVHGKVGMSTKLMIALYREAGHIFTEDLRTIEEARITLILRSGKRHTCKVTRAQAHAAHWDETYDEEKGVWKPKPAWVTTPDLMLMNRCASRAIRAFTPEVLFRKQAKQTTYTADELHDADVIDSTAREVPQPPIQSGAPTPPPTTQTVTTPPTPPTPPPPQAPGGNGNDPQDVSEDDLPPVEFQRKFFAWLENAGEYNKLSLTGKPLYNALKATGKMKPHLRMYTKLEFAEADALLALAELKRLEQGAGK